MRPVWRTAVAAWKFFVGVLLCQTPVTAVLVVGWTYRLMQRAALQAWWKASSMEGDFVRFTGADDTTRGHGSFPNWVLAQGPRRTIAEGWRRNATLRGKLGAVPKGLSGSFAANLRVGLGGMVNT